MTLHLGLRRSVRSVTQMSQEEPTPTARRLDAGQSAARPVPDGGLIERYARRRSRAALVAAAPDGRSEEARPIVLPIGRGSEEHESDPGSTATAPTFAAEPPPVPRSMRRRRRDSKNTLRQRLIAATLAVAIGIVSLPGVATAQQRYRVQPGDTLESVAAEFGVDPEAIRRSSWFSNPPDLTPGDVIIIPDPGQTPEEAALVAAENVGTSPWTVGAYWVQAGDTIESIAATYGVDPGALLDINGLDWDDYIYPGDRLVIPGTGEEGYEAAATVSGSGSASTGATPSLDAYVWVPTHRQERNLSCEYAAVQIATSAFGNAIPESVLADAIPVTSNPHYGYRGDIDGVWGNYTDYGIYPEPLVPILNDYGYAAEVFYSMGDADQLKAHLDAGHPVVTWLAMWGDTGIVFDDEDTYTIFAGMHVMTAYGYSDDGVYLSDPGTGSYRFFDWDTFLWMWEPIDGMAMAVYPY